MGCNGVVRHMPGRSVQGRHAAQKRQFENYLASRDPNVPHIEVNGTSSITERDALLLTALLWLKQPLVQHGAEYQMMWFSNLRFDESYKPEIFVSNLDVCEPPEMSMNDGFYPNKNYVPSSKEVLEV